MKIDELINTLISYSKKYLLLSYLIMDVISHLEVVLGYLRLLKSFKMLFTFCGLGGRHIDENKLDLKRILIVITDGS